MSIEFFLGSFLVIIAAIGLPIAFFEERRRNLALFL